MTTHLPVINFTDICHLKQPKEDNEMKAVVKSHPTNWFSCAAFDVKSKYFIYLNDLDYQQFRNNLTSVNFRDMIDKVYLSIILGQKFTFT